MSQIQSKAPSSSISLYILTASRGIPFAGFVQNAVISPRLHPGCAATKEAIASLAAAAACPPPVLLHTSQVPQSDDSSCPK